MTGVNLGLPSLLFWYSLKRICKFLFPTIVFTFVLFKYFDSYELEFDILAPVFTHLCMQCLEKM